MSPEAAGADIPTAHLFFVSFSLLRPVVLFKKTSQQQTPVHTHYPSFHLFMVTLLSGFHDFLSPNVFFSHGGQDVLSIDGCECFI